MIEHSFLHVPGVGQKTEAYLKRLGVARWSDWFALRDRVSVQLGLRAQLDRVLEESLAALARRDLQALAALLSPGEVWRLAARFPDLRIGYFDIETTGLDRHHSHITVAGLWDGTRETVFVRGRNLERLPQALAACDILVTFNGKRFDLPFVEHAFGIKLSMPHVDLVYPCRRLGLRGGLKAIETRLGIGRSAETQGLGGLDAVILWHSHLEGTPGALERLIRYNLEDVRHLEGVLAHVVAELSLAELSS